MPTIRLEDIERFRKSWAQIRDSRLSPVILLRGSESLPAQQIKIVTKIKIAEDFTIPASTSVMQLALFGAVNLDIQVGDRFAYNSQAAVVTNVVAERLMQTTAYAEVTT